MFDKNEIDRLIGRDAFSIDGARIGLVGHLYFNQYTGKADWAAVYMGFFGTKERLVPHHGAESSHGRLTLPCEKQRVRHAPKATAAGHLTQDQEWTLREHYGLGAS